MQVAFFCCFREGVAGMSRDLGRDVPKQNFGLLFRTLITVTTYIMPAEFVRVL